MAQPRLNHVLMLHLHKDKTDQLKGVDIAKQFISFNEQHKTQKHFLVTMEVISD